ncbi:MAG: ATP-dependent helicase, partial [Candidatus Omnitrophica bacterium]|nr:ATP-dependent helicase [Candidatus Omnitrophota bacterium]
MISTPTRRQNNLPQVSAPHSELLDALTAAQREAVTHPEGPLLIIAGAGTGKTTVITRRIAWLLATQRATPESLLALTFTEKAAAEMEERVDLLIPYGYSRLSISTFHAFGDQLLRQYALKMGFSSQFKVLSQAEQVVFLRQHLFELPLKTLRPLNDPTRFLEALLGVFSRAKDEAVTTEEFLACTDRLQQAAGGNEPALEALIQRTSEIALCYAAYQKLMRDADAIDFGDQVLLAIQLLEKHPDVLQAVRQRYAFLLVDEFQDTNFAQYRLLQLLAKPEGNITVVADDDQSIYKWRGAAISNVLKFLDHYPSRHTVVLTENFRSNQHILDAAYRLIRFNDPDRLEAQQGIDKRLISKAQQPLEMPHFSVFDDASAEADWVARTIRNAIEEQKRHPGDFAILVRSNREADLFLRAFNVAGIPWQFSGSSGLFARPESKMLLSCLKALADPHDSLSWYHIASSALYRCPMKDLAKILALAERSHQSFQNILSTTSPELSEEGQRILGELKQDIEELLEFSRTQSSGQLLYHWLSKRGFLAHLARVEDLETSLQLQTVARFFAQLRRIEDLAGSSLPEVIQQLDLFQAIGNEPLENDDPLADRVNVLTLHKAKGLEFPVVFLVGLVQGRFPTPRRTETLELPNELIKDILPSGDYHLQEERRLFYVGMTRAKESLYLSCTYNYGGKSIRKISQFVVEALDLATPSPPARRSSAKELIDRSRLQSPLPLKRSSIASKPQRLDPHGIDDYLTCPLKYRYSHVLRIPVM